MTNTFFRFSVIGILTQLLVLSVNGQSRRPTISFISQPEIVTDIGGTVELKCSVQVIKLPPHNILKSNEYIHKPDIEMITYAVILFDK